MARLTRPWTMQFENDVLDMLRKGGIDPDSLAQEGISATGYWQFVTQDEAQEFIARGTIMAGAFVVRKKWPSKEFAKRFLTLLATGEVLPEDQSADGE